MASVEQPIKVGQKWEQRFARRDGVVRMRVIEIIGAPTLSSPVNFRIVQNDAHPHRKGKVASIRRSDLRRKYWTVAA